MAGPRPVLPVQHLPKLVDLFAGHPPKGINLTAVEGVLGQSHQARMADMALITADDLYETGRLLDEIWLPEPLYRSKRFYLDRLDRYPEQPHEADVRGYVENALLAVDASWFSNLGLDPNLDIDSYLSSRGIQGAYLLLVDGRLYADRILSILANPCSDAIPDGADAIFTGALTVYRQRIHHLSNLYCPNKNQAKFLSSDREQLIAIEKRRAFAVWQTQHTAATRVLVNEAISINWKGLREDEASYYTTEIRPHLAPGRDPTRRSPDDAYIDLTVTSDQLRLVRYIVLPSDIDQIDERYIAQEQLQLLRYALAADKPGVDAAGIEVVVDGETIPASLLDGFHAVLKLTKVPYQLRLWQQNVVQVHGLLHEMLMETVPLSTWRPLPPLPYQPKR